MDVEIWLDEMYAYSGVVWDRITIYYVAWVRNLVYYDGITLSKMAQTFRF